jgi:histidyl-tRNA synthetase
VVAEHQAKLPKLFKRYQIQPVWRADRPARGRFREFYQCDVDALGSTSPVVEAELCAAVADVLTELGFDDFVIRINHRQLLTSLLNAYGVAAALHGDALVAIDKLDKIGRDGVGTEFAERGISAASGAALLDIFAKGDVDTTATALDDVGLAALTNLVAIQSLVDGTRAAGRMKVDLTLARGLSYYTGAIMEINVPDLAGSLGGGGRYDNLVGMFLGQDIPACGFSLGLERILVVMGERGMFPPALAMTPADVMLSVFDAAGIPHAMRLADTLRRGGLRALVYPDADKIGKQIKYADSRGIPFVALLGGDEIRDNTVTVKNLAAQSQATYPQASAAAAILEELKKRG